MSHASFWKSLPQTSRTACKREGVAEGVSPGRSPGGQSRPRTGGRYRYGREDAAPGTEGLADWAAQPVGGLRGEVVTASVQGGKVTLGEGTPASVKS